jgi:hypothetical protein
MEIRVVSIRIRIFHSKNVKKLSQKIFLFDKTVDVYHQNQVTFYTDTVRNICTYIVQLLPIVWF